MDLFTNQEAPKPHSIQNFMEASSSITPSPPVLETNSIVPGVSLALMASHPALPHCPETHLLKQVTLLGGDPTLLPTSAPFQITSPGQSQAFLSLLLKPSSDVCVFVLPGFLSSVSLTITAHRKSPCLVRCPVPPAFSIGGQ